MAAQSQPDVPGLPGREGRFRVHALGDSVLHGFRLAATVLFDEQGRVREDLSRAARGDRLVEIRTREARVVRELHGTLRVRTHRRAAHYRVAEGIDSRGLRQLGTPSD